jgi:DNA-binding CsgD family transcriptional regulator
MPLTAPAETPSIRNRSTSPNYAHQALDAITQIAAASDPPELLDRLAAATEALGATASVYSASIPEDGHETSGFSLYACHPAFALEHQGQGASRDHPWFRFACTHTMPGTDHQILPRHATDAAAIDLARRYGFRSALIVPTRARAGIDRLDMLCVGSVHADDFEGPEARAVRSLARALAAELQDWLTRHLRIRMQESARLQKLDIELLGMEWEGLGTKEICHRTGMTTASVDSRFQRINARLNCASRKASAHRAAAYGLLELG